MCESASRPDVSEDLRRKDDLQLAALDKRLSLSEQARDLHAQVQDARLATISESMKSLDSKIDSATERLAAKIDTTLAAIAEPTSSPAGRALQSEIDELRNKVERIDGSVTGHDTFLSEVRGALKLARFALGTSFLAVLGNIALAFAYVAGQG